MTGGSADTFLLVVAVKGQREEDIAMFGERIISSRSLPGTQFINVSDLSIAS